MPLVSLQSESQQSWALWKLSETEHDLASLVNEPVPAEIVAETKRLEWFGSRMVIRELCQSAGLSFQGITKDENGKPYLQNHSVEISLSHSYPYVAAQFSRKFSVGIDVEQPKEKLLKVATRILSSSEQNDAGTDIIKHCVYWSAKESLYKIYGKGGVYFMRDLQISPFTLNDSGKLIGTIHHNSTRQVVSLGYQIHSDFVIVFTLNHLS